MPACLWLMPTFSLGTLSWVPGNRGKGCWGEALGGRAWV